MAAGNKYYNGINDILSGTINFNTDTFKIALSLSQPAFTYYHYSDFSGTELGNGNGYTTGGLTLTGVARSYASGVVSVAANPVTMTASGGGIGPWRWYSVYDSTTGTMLGFYDYGATTTIPNGQAVPFSFVNNILLQIS